ncbi:MAG: metallophosphoesterase [Candidatus Anstonellales archaeon]
MIRILALADLHNDEMVLDRLRVLESDRKYDYLVVAGDVTGKNISYAQDFISIVQQVFWVPGNNESEEVRRMFEDAKFSVHGKRVEIKEGFNVVGFGFSTPTPFKTPGEMPEEEIYAHMSSLKIDANTILITHSPPHGLFDSIGEGINIGSRSIRKIIEEKQPKLALFGHVHEHFGKANIGRTICIKIPHAPSLKAAAVEIRHGHAEVYFVEI